MIEEDIKNRVVLPFLNDLGFESKNLKFEENIKLILGKNKKEPMKDYIINVIAKNIKNFMDYLNYWNEKYYRNGFVDGVQIIGGCINF